MKSRPLDATELEAELLRLNTLVRERRKQLDRLKNCPNPECPCRVVWRNVVEKNLAGQVGRIRRNVRAKSTVASKGKGTKARKSS
jgi:hypothetical protein